MSRKTKLSTVAQKLPKQKTFEGQAVPYQFLDEEKQIAKALDEDKIATKERELLEKELEKPFNKRNKALMNKYSGTAEKFLMAGLLTPRWWLRGHRHRFRRRRHSNFRSTNALVRNHQNP
jgi:hypothetical protein